MTESSLQFNAKGRYHALEISEHWDLNWIRSLRALVVGAGALGNEVTKNLAMMGVKEIVIVDHDHVEVSNLTRSVFFREEDKGRAKVDVLAQRLRDLNPDVHVQPLLGKYSEVVGLGRLRHMDLIFSCLDNRTARSELNEACQKVGMAWVNGGMENLLGEVSLYLPDEGPCYECLMTADVRKAINQARSCQKVALDAIAAGRAPTTSTMGSIISAMQVQEALKIGQRHQPSGTGGKRIVFNCLDNDFYTTRGQRREDCLAHKRFGEITEMPQWSAATTTPREIIEYARQEMNSEAYLRLGRDVVVGIDWPATKQTREFEHALLRLTVSQARNESGVIGNPRHINKVLIDGDYADWPLARLAIPAWDILEVRTAKGFRFYELTGDATQVMS